MRRLAPHYDRERSKGRTYSMVLHLLFLLLAIFGLPSFLSPPPPEEPMVITVDLLPISSISNVKPSETLPKPETKADEKKPEPVKSSPPVKTADSAPPPPPEPTLSDKPKEKPSDVKKEKKPEPKKDEKKQKPKEDDLAAILKAVKETAQKEKKLEDKKPKKEAKENKEPTPTKTMSNQYNPGLPMSMTEKDAIMSQLAKCWSVPAGAKDAQNLVVVVNAEYNIDGSYIRVELSKESQSRYNSDTFFRTAAESAIRAVKECSPLKDLPADKYNTWRSMELSFDPKLMLN